jgi:succinate dehydrogenase / fumarate reductase flavoprotein subunit
MRIYPAIHYTMGGLWVDYNLMSTIPGLFVAGEANFSDHGANRLGASALMQGLADGYFVLPYTIGHYLASAAQPCKGERRRDHPEVKAAEAGQERASTAPRPSRASARSTASTASSASHHVGQLRHGPHREGPERRSKIPELREEFWRT